MDCAESRAAHREASRRALHAARVDRRRGRGAGQAKAAIEQVAGSLREGRSRHRRGSRPRRGAQVGESRAAEGLGVEGRVLAVQAGKRTSTCAASGCAARVSEPGSGRRRPPRRTVEGERQRDGECPRRRGHRDQRHRLFRRGGAQPGRAVLDDLLSPTSARSGSSTVRDGPAARSISEFLDRHPWWHHQSAPQEHGGAVSRGGVEGLVRCSCGLRRGSARPRGHRAGGAGVAVVKKAGTSYKGRARSTARRPVVPREPREGVLPLLGCGWAATSSVRRAAGEGRASPTPSAARRKFGLACPRPARRERGGRAGPRDAPEDPRGRGGLVPPAARDAGRRARPPADRGPRRDGRDHRGARLGYARRPGTSCWPTCAPGIPAPLLLRSGLVLERDNGRSSIASATA